MLKINYVRMYKNKLESAKVKGSHFMVASADFKGFNFEEKDIRLISVTVDRIQRVSRIS